MNEFMRQGINKIIEVPDDVKSLEDISKLNLTHLKGIDKRIANILKTTLNVNTIVELAIKKIKNQEYTILKSLGIKEFNLNVWISISKMILNNEIEKLVGPTKISIFGLEEAGKTTILNLLENKINIGNIHNLSPTKGVNRKILQQLGVEFAIFDMGGQEIYRLEYINDPEKYFVGIEFLIFVIDIQDSEKHKTALDYLRKIIELVIALKQNPVFWIIFHKFDPDLEENEEIKASIEELKTAINAIFRDSSLQYDMSTCSIYNYLGYNNLGSKELKALLKTKPTEMGKSFEQSIEYLVNLITNLSASVEHRFSRIENAFRNLCDLVENAEIFTTDIKKGDENIKEPESLAKAFYNELRSALRTKKVF